MMKRTALTRGLFLSLFLALTPSIRADVIHWDYDWARSPNQVSADPLGPHSAGTGSILFFPAKAGSADNSTDIVAFNMSTISSAPDASNNPDRFTSRPYTLSVTITDAASHKSGTADFSGALSGTLTFDSANITNVFNSPAVVKLLLGSNLYTVSLNSFTKPGQPGSESFGAIGAHVNVAANGDPPVQNVPEPSTLLLGVSGCVSCFIARLRRRVTVLE